LESNGINLEKIKKKKYFTILLLTKYYLGDEIKQNKMGGPCGTLGGEQRSMESYDEEI